MDPIQRLLSESKTIAVVGIWENRSRPSHEVAEYLQKRGYRIIPVNPNLNEVLGEKCYPDLASVDQKIDVVDIFRNPEAVPEIVTQAIEKRAKAVWMQPGAENMQAAEQAMEAGLEVIMGVCMMREQSALV
jgi:predicted CoA-binding protein